MNDRTTSIIAKRKVTHGNFKTNAKISQAIKRALRDNQWWMTLSDDHKEALDMIALKMSRIVSGHGGFVEHWDDIAGYARLIVDDLIGDQNAKGNEGGEDLHQAEVGRKVGVDLSPYSTERVGPILENRKAAEEWIERQTRSKGTSSPQPRGRSRKRPVPGREKGVGPAR